MYILYEVLLYCSNHLLYILQQDSPTCKLHVAWGSEVLPTQRLTKSKSSNADTSGVCITHITVKRVTSAQPLRYPLLPGIGCQICYYGLIAVFNISPNLSFSRDGMWHFKSHSSRGAGNHFLINDIKTSPTDIQLLNKNTFLVYQIFKVSYSSWTILFCNSLLVTRFISCSFHVFKKYLYTVPFPSLTVPKNSTVLHKILFFFKVLLLQPCCIRINTKALGFII
jgi:hypothetical protein